MATLRGAGSTPTEPPDSGAGVRTRRRRKREATHRKLVEAARVVMAEKGVEASTIQEITDGADVGFGTFYNHFESKEALLDELVSYLIEELVDSMDEITSAIQDPAVAMATVITNLIRLVDVDPVLGSLGVQVGAIRPELGNAVAAHIRGVLEAGIASGRFDVGDRRSATVVIGGAINLAMQLRLDERLEREEEGHHVELLLRMIGLSRSEAVEIAGGPLPQLPASRPPM